MLITPPTGVTRPKRNTTPITCRIIIRTIRGTDTTAARITTASELLRVKSHRSPHRSKVTETSLFRSNAAVQRVSIIDMNMENPNSIMVRVSRFFSDRYAYKSQPGYASEFVVFGTIVLVAVWPIILAAHAMAVSPK